MSTFASELIAGNITINNTDRSTVQEYDRFSIGAAAGSVDTYDISHCDEVVVTVDTDGSTDALSIYASVDGTNFDAIPVEGRDLTAAIVSCTGTADNIYTIPFNGKKLRFTKAGTTDTYTISWSARNSGRGAV